MNLRASATCRAAALSPTGGLSRPARASAESDVYHSRTSASLAILFFAPKYFIAASAWKSARAQIRTATAFIQGVQSSGFEARLCLARSLFNWFLIDASRSRSSETCDCKSANDVMAADHNKM